MFRPLWSTQSNAFKTNEINEQLNVHVYAIMKSCEYSFNDTTVEHHNSSNAIHPDLKRDWRCININWKEHVCLCLCSMSE